MTLRRALIFLSYRRDDTGPYALALRSELELRLDGVPVFLDINRIQGGNLWAHVLDDALAKATVLVALIGPHWMGETDGGPSRLDDPQDWVRKEVARALRHPSNAVLPVLVNCPHLPPRERLPKDIRRLLDIQAIPLRSQSWDVDVAQLCDVLRDRFSIHLRDFQEALPEPDELKTLEDVLSDNALGEAERRGILKGWDVEIVHDVHKSAYVRESLRKRFDCASDASAAKFVNGMMELAEKAEHHPRIEILYRTVTVRLTTLDRGYRITTFDRKMAVEIDRLFSRLFRAT